MQLQLKTSPKLTHKLRLTPQIRLSINLLQLPLVKLKEFIEQEIEKNPLLDAGNMEYLLRPTKKFEEIIEEDKDSEADSFTSREILSERKNYRESLITNLPSLAEHLLRQLQLLTNSAQDYKIGELIIGNIDDNGYLRCTIEDLAKSAKTELPKVEEVLSLIQSFDPTGVGAGDLRECLLLQLKTKGRENSLAGKIIDKYLSCLEKKRYGYIAKKLSARGGPARRGKVSVEMVKEAMKEIASLEPKPGCSFSAERTVRLIPDALLRKNEEEEYEIVFNDEELPHIIINDKYRQILKQKDAPQDVKEYLRERLGAARSLINAVQRRKETIKKIIEEIISVQKDFLDSGISDFKPLTLEQIAERIGKHKSTVSRAMANKYIHTPWGIFELRYFLSCGVRQENGRLISSKTIKSKIKDLIENENKENPLSDREITCLLKQDAISVCRRTIAKYRMQLKILSSKSRRQ